MSETQAEKHPDPSVHWFHRRSMAYLSLAGLFVTLFMIWMDKIPGGSAPVAQTLAWVFGLVICAYVANNAVEKIAAMRYSK